VKVNIETKVEAGAPAQTASREQFVDVAIREMKAVNMEHRVSIQSYGAPHVLGWGSFR
jgi:glycerophosphoryl diester phosphodiesterase